MNDVLEINLTVNGEKISRSVPARLNLVDFLREDLKLTGSHVGCEHGACGACTIRVNNDIVRGCLMLAVQADGTVELVHKAQPGAERQERCGTNARLMLRKLREASTCQHSQLSCDHQVLPGDHLAIFRKSYDDIA